jgi:hypothetical protein
LGSQVKLTEANLFGSFGSEGILGETGTEGGTGNGTTVVSDIPNYIWIGLALLLGYFLIK